MTAAIHGSPAFAAFAQGRDPLYVGRYEHHAGRGAGKGVHAYAVMFLVSEGISRVRHGQELVLRQGDLHLIPPGDVHGTPHFENVSGWVLAFWPEQSTQAFRLLSEVRHGCHPVFHPSPDQRTRLERWLEALEAECAGNAEGRSDALAALLQLVLIEVARVSRPLPVSSEASTLARQALEFIEVNSLRPLALTDVARAVSRSAAHVATTVRRETGRTVGEWILAKRMGEARRRLRETDAAMETVARQVGYADVTHFIRQFRRVHGTTPAQWKRLSRA